MASEDDPLSGSANGRAGRGANPIRKRINIKLRPSSKGRASAGASASSASKKTTKSAKTVHDAPVNDRALLEVVTNNERPFGLYSIVTQHTFE